MNFHYFLPDIEAYRNYAATRHPCLLTPRPKNSHKGTFGTVGIVGGAEGMCGAVLLAGEAALYAGCGKVIIGFNQDTLPLPVYERTPELMLDTAAKLVYRNNIDIWIAGCGMGRNESAARILNILWKGNYPKLVLDADATYLLAAYPKLFTRTTRRDLVLTPHPGEAAYLLGTSIPHIQNNRTWAVRELASRYYCTVVLKGRKSLVCDAYGTVYTNNSGNPGLATAGSGDVLSGLIGSLMAQGIATNEAVKAAVWLHGAAAEILAYAQTGPVGLLAGEIAQAARWLRNQMAA